jgi:hypothetical protein
MGSSSPTTATTHGPLHRAFSRPVQGLSERLTLDLGHLGAAASGRRQARDDFRFPLNHLGIHARIPLGHNVFAFRARSSRGRRLPVCPNAVRYGSCGRHLRRGFVWRLTGHWLMKLVAEYLERSVQFERMAAEADDPNLKQQLLE